MAAVLLQCGDEPLRELGRIESVWVPLELVGERRSQSPRLRRPRREVGRRKDQLAVCDLDRIQRIGVHDALLPPPADTHFRRGQKSRAQAHSDGAESERGRHPTTIGDTSGRHHGGVPGEVNDRRHQHQGAHPAAIAARLPALGNEDIGPSRPRFFGLGPRPRPEPDHSILGPSRPARPGNPDVSIESRRLFRYDAVPFGSSDERVGSSDDFHGVSFGHQALTLRR